jgi:broad specificity phosphatase PhoE
MELYLIRHGQSYNNALPDQTQRVAEPPLTALGLRQAATVAQHLAEGINMDFIVRNANTVEMTQLTYQKGYGITKLYCSAMHRAMQTAQPIGQALGLNPEIWLDIHEYGGIHSTVAGEEVGQPGKTRAEILAEFPNYILPDGVTDKGWWFGGHEDWPLCHARAIRTARALKERAHLKEKIGLVAHGGFIDVLLKALLNQLPSINLFYHLYNTSITRLDLDPEGRFVEVIFLNRIHHLPPELIS